VDHAALRAVDVPAFGDSTGISASGLARGRWWQPAVRHV